MCKCIWLYTCIFPYTCVEIREQVTGPVFFTLFAGIELRSSAGYFFFKKILLCVYVVIHACVWTCMQTHVWKSEDNFVELVFSFHFFVGSRLMKQVLYLLSCMAGQDLYSDLPGMLLLSVCGYWLVCHQGLNLWLLSASPLILKIFKFKPDNIWIDSYLKHSLRSFYYTHMHTHTHTLFLLGIWLGRCPCQELYL